MKQIAEYLWIICFVVSVYGESDALPICNDGPLSRFIAAQSDIPMTIDSRITEKPQKITYSPTPAGPVGSVFSGDRRANRPDPCKATNYRIIDDPDVRQAFLKLWEASRTDRPLNQRMEQGGWIVSNGEEEYKVIPFPSSWPKNPCEIVIPDNFFDLIPANLVGIVHTHPFFEGENTTASDVCGKEGLKSYKSGSNNNDLNFLIQIANHLSDFCVKEYIIDGENITSMNTFRHLVYYPADTFFAEQSLDYNLANKTKPEPLKNDYHF